MQRLQGWPVAAALDGNLGREEHAAACYLGARWPLCTTTGTRRHHGREGFQRSVRGVLARFRRVRNSRIGHMAAALTCETRRPLR